MIKYIIPSVSSQLKLERHCPNCGRFGGNIHSSIHYRPISDIKASSIAMPRIGAGYGGLSWKKVRPIIEQAFNDWPGKLYVYEEFVPGEQK